MGPPTRPERNPHTGICRSGFLHFRGLMDSQPRSGADMLSEQLGGEHHFRQFCASVAAANKLGGPIRIEYSAEPITGEVQRAPVVLAGRRAW